MISACFIKPMLSLAVTKLPKGSEGCYEVKFDGYRTQGIKSGSAPSAVQRKFQRASPSQRGHSKHFPMKTIIDGVRGGFAGIVIAACSLFKKKLRSRLIG
jgi:hypothetical protein